MSVASICSELPGDLLQPTTKTQPLVTPSRPTASLLGTVVIGFLLQVAIRPDLVTRPQFWAEDGTQWFRTAYESGGQLNLFTLYGGYLHLIPRLTAAIGQSAVPLSLLPLFYNVTALLISSVSLSIFVLPTFRSLVPSDVVRFAFVLSLLVANPSGEIVGTITNAQWFVGLGSVALVYLPASTAARAVLACAFITLSALSAPTMVFLAAFVLPALLKPERAVRAKAVLYLGSVCVSLVVAKLLGGGTQPRAVDVSELAAASWDTLAAVLSVPIAGYRPAYVIYQTLGEMAPLIFLFVLGAVAVVLWRRGQRTHRTFIVCLAGFLATYVPAMSFLRPELFAHGASPMLLSSPDPDFDAYNHSRYLFLPFCFISLLVLQLGAVADGAMRARLFRLPVFQALLVTLACTKTAFFSPPLYLNWDEYAAKIERGWSGVVPVQPTSYGWTIEIAAPEQQSRRPRFPVSLWIGSPSTATITTTDASSRSDTGP